MHALILALALTAGGSGAAHRPGVIRRPAVIGPFAVEGGLIAGAVAMRWQAPSALTLTTIQWTEKTAGIGTSMTYAVAVDGVAACSLTVACDTVGLISQDCSASVLVGSNLSVMVSADNCLVSNPAGSLMLTVR